MTSPTSLLWFRQDLRLSDNPALVHAVKKGNILPVYILDTENAGSNFLGAASRAWLYHSLHALNASLKGKLQFFIGDPKKIVPNLCQEMAIDTVFWNRCYEPWRMERDTHLKESLKETGVTVSSHNGSLLWEPWSVTKKDKTPYRVFTPFFRKGCLQTTPPRAPLSKPAQINLCETPSTQSVPLQDLNLLPTLPWGKEMCQHWDIGEDGAQKQLDAFLETGLSGYKTGRDFPKKSNVSRLSPYLQTGEISPHQVWHAATLAAEIQHLETDIDHFKSELGWREFSYQLLFHNHDLPTKNLQSKFNAFPWRENDAFLTAWQQGQTGYPIIDAGMRELWQTGYMHNRVRMIVGSFLVKNLRLDWRLGEQWFWDCLVDADLANNSASWQWIAGCGADAAPYFRIFNPVTQAEKFDPDGTYIRKYVPELRELPDKYLSSPWEAPDLLLRGANVILGKTYPHPIVDLKKSREEALSAYQEIKSSS